MAHESFENPQIAARMNELFVNIKVDREERPDLDAIYQHALALMGEQGGWPLDDVPDPRRRAVLGRHLFPAGAALGPARASRRCCEAMSNAYRARPRQGREERRRAARGAATARPAGARRRDRPGAARPHRRAAAARGRPAQWRHRHRAEIPADRDLRIAVARLEAHRPGALSRCRREGPRRDVPGRHLRPSRRRLRPLFDRCALARAAFREDALRQCRARRSADPGLAGDQEPALSRSGSTRRSAG